MEILSLLVLWIHIIAATIWLGGNFMISFVIMPYFRRSLAPIERMQILVQLGRRFEPVVWTCVLALIFSGLFNILTSGAISSPDLIGPFMRTLGIKVVLVVILIILTGIHAFFVGPRLSKVLDTMESDTDEPSKEIKRLSSQVKVLSVLTGVFSLLVLLAAVALRMGI